MKSFKKGIFLLIILIASFACGDDEGSSPQLTAPLALNAVNISQTSFTAKWVGVANATSYELDVSEQANFTTFVDGYESKVINGITELVSNLSSNTEYYYRVRATNGNAKSINSNVVTLTTNIPSGVPLKDASKDFFIGTIVQSNRMTGTHNTVINREFSSITAEYEMKMNIMYPNEGSYDWSKSDAIVDYAQNNGLNLHGHALIWHNATPDWVENYPGTDAEFEAMIEDYIKTVVTRYKGKITSWDVVNEAFNDNSGSYRNSVFYQRMGEDYIAKCFTWAREADENVLLFYNDYNMCTDAAKQNAVFTLVDDFINNSIPIDGVGFQMHISYNWPSASDIQTATQMIIDRNLKVHYAELDVRANPNNDLSSLTPARSLEQKEKYKEIAKLYSAIPDANKYALTIWGLKDNESWLMDFWGHVDWPLLYDSNFDEKDAYYGFLEGLLE